MTRRREWVTAVKAEPFPASLRSLKATLLCLANLTKHTIAELTVLVKTRLKRMQYRPGLLAGFLASTGLEFKPFL